FLARLDSDVSSEDLDAYWQKMVQSHFDMISGNISVAVRAFTPQDSLQLANAIIKESDSMFGNLNSQAQKDFVKIADDNLDKSEKRVNTARTALLKFRQQHQVLFPDNVAQSSSVIVDSLRQQLGNLTAKYESTDALSPHSPTLGPLRSQIDALKHQIVAA